MVDVNGMDLNIPIDSNNFTPPVSQSNGIDIGQLVSSFFNLLSQNFSTLVDLSKTKSIYIVFFVASLLAVRFAIEHFFNVHGIFAWILAIIACLVLVGFIVSITDSSTPILNSVINGGVSQ